MGQKTINRVGQVIGKLTIVEFIRRDSKNVYWKARCECGKEVIVPYGNLRRNTSCGCFRKDRVGKKSKHWKGCGDIPASYLWKLKGHASRRKIEVTITVEYLWKLWQEQQGSCALSGLILTYPQSFRKLSSGLGNASLDRIDSYKGYIEGNVQWVDKDINFMKQRLSQDRFIELCNTVSRHQEVKT